MKKIVYLFALMLFAASCEDEGETYYENPVTASNIKLIKLRADHQTVLGNGKACMKFYADAYNILELPDYTPSYDGDSAVYEPSIKRDTSLIPRDLLPKGLFKLYDETGKEYPDFKFSTTDPTQRSIRFHLEAGELSSEELEIKVRPLPEKEYEPIVIPVIFHVMNFSKNPSIPAIEITEKVIKKNIDRLNAVFAGSASTDPNGGDAKITFRLAEYDNIGIKLDIPGMHLYEIPNDEKFEKDEDFSQYVMDERSELLYDYRHFLNIWLINNPTGNSYSSKAPTVIDDINNPIPGLEAKEITASFPEKPEEVGIFINMSNFLNPYQFMDYFEISTTVGRYLGLLTTQASELGGVTNMVDGDTDFCQDTPYYWGEISSVFKNNAKEGQKEGVMYFTSYNIMDRYSYKNSISCDQIDRMRQHLDRCPSRWMYKSDFAFTGTK